jgi:putative DNA-invertase from lambdoid prophage Rac
LATLASLAKVEAQKIGERTKAGMARAKKEGKRIGRPSISAKVQEQIARRMGAGETAYAVAKDLGIDRHTAMKYAPSLSQAPPREAQKPHLARPGPGQEILSRL